MDFLVTEAEQDTIPTEAIHDETYPGLKVYEMTRIQEEAVGEALEMNHLSPIISGEETDETDDEVIDELPHHAPLPTLPTPNIHSEIPHEKCMEELKEEVLELRKRVALTANMKTVLAKLNGTEDQMFQVEFVKNYSRRKFNIILTDNDFDSLTTDQIAGMYKKTRESEKVDKFEVIYKTAFDFIVSSLETVLNRYCFEVSNLNQYLVYEDISNEIQEFKSSIESTAVGKYIDNTSPFTRVLTYLVIQVGRAKLRV